MTQHFDVIVIGGGPAGSTAASVLARAGRRVLVVEKEKFPRYHIGESLVPGVLPVLDEIGAREVIENAGFQRKYGITLLWGKQDQLWTVRFGEAGPYEYVYEVKRAEFDNLLLLHARTQGATVVEEATVKDVRFEDGRCVGITYARANEEPVEVRADQVVDCSGQARVLARKIDAVEWHEDLKNFAVWAYYQGGERLDGIDAGNIVVEHHADGWLWNIPFSDGTRSLGFVGPNKEVLGKGQSPQEILESRIATSQVARRQLATATRVSGFRTARDWSYTSTSFSGPGYMIAGDAAAFIDPLFSTGVMLAMRSGLLAGQAVHNILTAPGTEHAEQSAYEARYSEFLDVVRSFVRYFYDSNREVASYWEKAQEMVDPVERWAARSDFILLISGLNAARPIFSDEGAELAPPDPAGVGR
jgi:flavin-dependent dehydrogenase